MRKWIIPLIVLGVLVLGGVWLIIVNNELQRLEEDIESQWSVVHKIHQERTNLIPTLLTAASEYAEFEEETLENILSAHREAQQPPMGETQIAHRELGQFARVHSQLSTSLLDLQYVFNRYPYLKKYPAFKLSVKELDSLNQSMQLERAKFNERVGLYNTELSVFPKNVFAAILGYSEHDFFKPE